MEIRKKNEVKISLKKMLELMNTNTNIDVQIVNQPGKFPWIDYNEKVSKLLAGEGRRNEDVMKMFSEAPVASVDLFVDDYDIGHLRLAIDTSIMQKG